MKCLHSPLYLAGLKSPLPGKSRFSLFGSGKFTSTKKFHFVEVQDSLVISKISTKALHSLCRIKNPDVQPVAVAEVIFHTKFKY